MRLLILVTLFIGSALSLWATGFVIDGNAYPNMQETDQVALIHLEKDRVNVDMYIAVDGIPAGKTVTYVLPFMYKPENFSLQTSMSFYKFFTTHTLKLRGQIELEQATIKDSAPKNMILATGLGGAMAGGPLAGLSATIAGIKYMPRWEGTRSYYFPRDWNSPLAIAHLYKIETSIELQQFIARAKLPEQSAQALARYHPKYYALIQLTGGPKKNAFTPPGGIYCSYSHTMTSHDASYTCTYPLGIGSAWTKPIQATEVYVTCDDEHYLSITAPTIGKSTSYPQYWDFTVQRDYDLDSSEQDIQQLTSTLLPDSMRFPTIWHRAYLNSNPIQDITIHLRPRPTGDMILRKFTNPVLPFILATILVIFSLIFSIYKVIRPAYMQSGCPGTLGSHITRYLLTVAQQFIIILFLFLLMIIPFIGVILVLVLPISGFVLWLKYLERIDGLLPARTMLRASLNSTGFYLAGVIILLMLAYGVQHLLIS